MGGGPSLATTGAAGARAAALASAGASAAVTVMRDKREQNLTLTLPEKKDTGSLLEDSFDVDEVEAETEQAIEDSCDLDEAEAETEQAINLARPAPEFSDPQMVT